MYLKHAKYNTISDCYESGLQSFKTRNEKKTLISSKLIFEDLETLNFYIWSSVKLN